MNETQLTENTKAIVPVTPCFALSVELRYLVLGVGRKCPSEHKPVVLASSRGSTWRLPRSLLALGDGITSKNSRSRSGAMPLLIKPRGISPSVGSCSIARPFPRAKVSKSYTVVRLSQEQFSPDIFKMAPDGNHAQRHNFEEVYFVDFFYTVNARSQ